MPNYRKSEIEGDGANGGCGCRSRRTCDQFMFRAVTAPRPDRTRRKALRRLISSLPDDANEHEQTRLCSVPIKPFDKALDDALFDPPKKRSGLQTVYIPN
jgi:hypothetical protein